MAPEVVKQTTYTKKADIWSVGCLIVEMLTGEHPWAQLNQMQAIFKVRLPAFFLFRRFSTVLELRPVLTLLRALYMLCLDWVRGCETGHPERYLCGCS